MTTTSAMPKYQNTFFVKAELTARIVPDESGGYVVHCDALQVCTQGDTIAEAKRNIVEAVELFIEGCIEMGTLAEVLADCGFHPTIPPPAKKSARANGAKINGVNGAKPPAVPDEITARLVRVPAELPVAAFG